MLFNFNLASWRSNGDFLAIGRDPALVAAFDRELFAPARSTARPAELVSVPRWRKVKVKVKAKALLGLGDAALARLSYRRMRRAAGWRG